MSHLPTLPVYLLAAMFALGLTVPSFLPDPTPMIAAR